MQQSPNILFGFMVVFSWQRSRKMEELSTPTPGSSNDRSTPSFPCSLCPYVGKCSSNLKSHNFYRHMTPEVKSYGASELSGYQIGSIVSLLQLEIFLSFKNRVSRAKHSEVKGIKKGHKIFHLSVYGWEGMHLSFCVFVLEKKLNNFWWNERILMKFSGPVQLFTSNF